MRDTDDDFRDFDEGPRFPATVMTAGIAWIGFGSLGLFLMLVSLVLRAAEPADVGPRDPAGKAGYQAGRVGGTICGGLIAGAFIFVGIQTVRGTAKDTLGNAIGSILLGALYAGVGLLVLVIGSATGRAGAPELLVGGIFAGLFGACLIGAGVLALVGRAEYKAWRQAQRVRTRPDEAL
jgi:hypothetical protein